MFVQSFPDRNTATVKNFEYCRFVHVRLSVRYIFKVGLLGQRENAFENMSLLFN